VTAVVHERPRAVESANTVAEIDAAATGKPSRRSLSPCSVRLGHQRSAQAVLELLPINIGWAPRVVRWG